MLNWPTAAVVITALIVFGIVAVVITVAVMQPLPKNSRDNDQNGTGS